MDAALFAKMLSDKDITDLKKLKYKYKNADIKEFSQLLKSGIYKTIPLPDFKGDNLVYLDNVIKLKLSAAKALLMSREYEGCFGIKAMESEISSTLTIESIDYSRESVRKILRGYAPTDDSESRIYGIKKGLEFISDTNNRITEENIYTLYELAIGKYLHDDDSLLPGSFYRHDNVYIVGNAIEHTGLAHTRLSGYMKELVQFACNGDDTNDLIKAAVIHFYIAYIHPYFDGNERMARLIHLWYLVQRGYPSALFIPLSEYIEKSRAKYYNAYTLCEQNESITSVLDITAFISYFIDNVYNIITLPSPSKDTDLFAKALEKGLVTEKEKDLWYFVMSAYGNNEFSTKQLEKDFGNAAYATIRSFVMKFENMGLLSAQKYKNKVKYRI